MGVPRLLVPRLLPHQRVAPWAAERIGRDGLTGPPASIAVPAVGSLSIEGVSAVSGTERQSARAPSSLSMSLLTVADLLLRGGLIIRIDSYLTPPLRPISGTYGRGASLRAHVRHFAPRATRVPQREHSHLAGATTIHAGCLTRTISVPGSSKRWANLERPVHDVDHLPLEPLSQRLRPWRGQPQDDIHLLGRPRGLEALAAHRCPYHQRAAPGAGFGVLHR